MQKNSCDEFILSVFLLLAVLTIASAPQMYTVKTKLFFIHSRREEKSREECKMKEL